MNNAVATRPANGLATLQQLLITHKDQIAMALPKHLTPERMIRVALTAVSRTHQLQSCDPKTVAACVVQASILGLEPEAALGEAYLVPFKVKGVQMCQLVIGYKGLIKLVRNSGQLSMINAATVREKDTFEFEDGLKPYVVHRKPSPFASPVDRGPVIGYWAGALLKDGSQQFVVMGKGEVEEHMRRYSKSYTLDSSPWKTEFDAMALKTCIRKLCKFLPQSVEVQTAIALDEQADTGVAQMFTSAVPTDLLPAATDTDDDDMPRAIDATATEQPSLINA